MLAISVADRLTSCVVSSLYPSLVVMPCRICVAMVCPSDAGCPRMGISNCVPESGASMSRLPSLGDIMILYFSVAM